MRNKAFSFFSSGTCFKTRFVKFLRFFLLIPFRSVAMQEKATKWETDKGIDGLTTNGVLLLHPKGDFNGGEAKAGGWLEVSVGGALYQLRDSRSAPQKKMQVT